MDNVLESYLVRLGFEPDQPSFNKFRGILHDAEGLVDQHSSGIVKTMLKAQTGIVGSFTAVSAAIIGMADKVAMADQGYRLFGLRMMMTQESARKMKMITEGLGASMEEIIWDPELHARAVTMAGDIDRMSTKLGPDFEKKMVAIRDMRAEFSRLSVAGQFLGMNFVSSLFSKFGTDIPGVQSKLESFVNYAIENGPLIADRLATYAVPVLKETWKILLDVGEAAKQFGVLFTNVIGLLSGDSSIEGASFSFDKVAKSIQHVMEWMDSFVTGITAAEKVLAHFAIGASLMLEKRFDAAGKEFRAGLAEMSPGAGAVLGGVIGGTVGMATAGPVGAVVGAGLGAYAGNKSTEAIRDSEKPADPVGDLRDAISIMRDTAKSGIAGLMSSGPSGLFGGAVAGYNSASSKVESRHAEPKGAPKDAGNWWEQYQSPKAAGGKAVSAFEARLADEIENFEGYYPKGTPGHKEGSISWRNNNPGNMRSDPATPGIVPTGKNEGFLVFKSYDDGRNALLGDIHSKVEQGLNLQSFMEKYAPKSDKNNPTEYAATVARRLGIDVKKPLSEFVGAETAAKPDVQTAAVTPDSTLQRLIRMNDAAAPPTVPGKPKRPDEASGHVSPWMRGATPADDQTVQSAMPRQDAIEASIAYTERPIAVPASNSVTNHQTVAVDVGGIHITQPDADPRDIHRAVADGIMHGLNRQTSLDLMQLQPAF